MSYNNDNKVASVTVAIQPQSTLSPWGTNTGFEYLQEVYEDLFEQDDSGDMYPVLADKSKGEFGGYDHKAGSGDYTVYLYDYIKDSAGNPITASDVKFSFEYQLNNATTSGWKKFQSVEVVDDTTCIFHFSSELTQIGELKNIWARCPIVSEAAFNASQSQFASDMCGTGPYMLESYASGASVVLVKNPNYWQTDASLLTQRQQANADKITYDFIDEAAQQVIALETGSVDAVYNVSASNLADFQEGGSYADQFSIKEWLQTGVRYIMCNCSKDSLCNDVNLRMAIFYAIDNSGLCAALGETSEQPAHSLISAAFPEYDTAWESWDNYENVSDLDRAKEYLSKTSYNGETLKLMCESVYSPTAEILQSMLLEAGINMEITTYDRDTINTLKGESDKWDIFLDQTAGDAGVVEASHWFNTSNTVEDRTDNFIEDPEWQTMLETILTEDGHTSENIDAWLQHAYDNAYGMALCSDINHIVYKNTITSVFKNDKNKLIPGAFTYAAQ